MSKSTSISRRARLWVMKRFPGTYVKLSQTYNFCLWKREKRGLAGAVAPQGAPSVLFYSYYRCGSMFLSRALRELAVANGLQHLDYCSYFVKVHPEQGSRLFDEATLARAFHPSGCHYGTLRRAYPIPSHELYRSVLLLRDPRDCLVSHYYSVRDSHTLNNRGNLEARREALRTDIDQWVLGKASEYAQDFEQFHARLVGKPGVLFLRYEEMVTAFPEFLRKVVAHTGLDQDEEAVARILEEADFEVSEENLLAHKRSVKPGNHLKKLKPETVASLNEALAEVLELFDYR